MKNGRNTEDKSINDLVILDYNTGEVHIYKVQEDKEIDNTYLDSLGHNPDDCYYMVGQFINIIDHRNETN